MVRAEILSADMIVFATPLYYYGMSVHDEKQPVPPDGLRTGKVRDGTVSPFLVDSGNCGDGVVIRNEN